MVSLRDALGGCIQGGKSSFRRARSDAHSCAGVHRTRRSAGSRREVNTRSVITATASPIVPLTGGWRLEHSYARLPAGFFASVSPTPVSSPRLVLLNRPLAEELGLDPAVLAENAAWFTGNVLPPGASPIAQAYAGHQYGNFVRLGDGRAILLGEQVTPRGERFDIQLKGPGPTPYSRRGDGRAG